MGRLILRIIASLLLFIGVLSGVSAAAIVTVLGSGNELMAKGFTIGSQDVMKCPSILLEVQSVNVDEAPFGFLLGPTEDYLAISTSPISTLSSVVVELPVVNDFLLGKSICVIDLNDGAKVQILDSGDQFLVPEDFSSVEIALEGERILVPADITRGKGLVTSLSQGLVENTSLSIDGLIVYPNASIILWISGAAAIVFVGAAIVLLLVTRRKKSHSSESKAASNES